MTSSCNACFATVDCVLALSGRLFQPSVRLVICYSILLSRKPCVFSKIIIIMPHAFVLNISLFWMYFYSFEEIESEAVIHKGT